MKRGSKEAFLKALEGISFDVNLSPEQILREWREIGDLGLYVDDGMDFLQRRQRPLYDFLLKRAAGRTSCLEEAGEEAAYTYLSAVLFTHELLLQAIPGLSKVRFNNTDIQVYKEVLEELVTDERWNDPAIAEGFSLLGAQPESDFYEFIVDFAPGLSPSLNEGMRMIVVECDEDLMTTFFEGYADMWFLLLRKFNEAGL